MIFRQITHLAVIAFKEGTFGFCLQQKDAKSEHGRLRKIFSIKGPINRVLTILQLWTVAANYVLHLPAYISGLDQPI
jgi:hypothetical protein